MSTLLDETAVSPSTSPSQRLCTSFAAVRIAFTWLGTRKTLTTEQKAQAADTFGAEGQFLSAGKKLLEQLRDRRAIGNVQVVGESAAIVVDYEKFHREFLVGMDVCFRSRGQ